MLTLFRGCGEREREGGGSGEKWPPALLPKDNRINSIQIWLHNELKRCTVNVILILKVDLRLPHISCKIIMGFWQISRCFFFFFFGGGGGAAWLQSVAAKQNSRWCEEFKRHTMKESSGCSCRPLVFSGHKLINHGCGVRANGSHTS